MSCVKPCSYLYYSKNSIGFSPWKSCVIFPKKTLKGWLNYNATFGFICNLHKYCSLVHFNGWPAYLSKRRGLHQQVDASSWAKFHRQIQPSKRRTESDGEPLPNLMTMRHLSAWSRSSPWRSAPGRSASWSCPAASSPRWRRSLKAKRTWNDQR